MLIIDFNIKHSKIEVDFYAIYLILNLFFIILNKNMFFYSFIKMAFYPQRHTKALIFYCEGENLFVLTSKNRYGEL